MLTAFRVVAHPDTVRLYHGTTKAAADDIMQNGWKSSDPKAVADRIAKLYHVDADELYNHQWFEFSRHREGDGFVYLDVDRQTAEHYAEAGSEMIEDALRTVYRMTHEPDDDTDGVQYTRDSGTWAKSEARNLDQPVILYIDCPWHLIEEANPMAMPGALEEYGVRGTVMLTPFQLRGVPVHELT